MNGFSATAYSYREKLNIKLKENLKSELKILRIKKYFQDRSYDLLIWVCYIILILCKATGNINTSFIIK